MALSLWEQKPHFVVFANFYTCKIRVMKPALMNCLQKPLKDLLEAQKAESIQQEANIESKPNQSPSPKPETPTPQNNQQNQNQTDSTYKPVTDPDTVYLKYGKAHSMDKPPSGNTGNNTIPRFLQTDEYFPLTRREMIKSWQYLRLKEKSGFMEQLDLKATIQKVAAEGVFTEPVFKTSYANREDAVIILADTRGSMTPFEGLTDRLIETARSEEGGHKNAPVFYFQNYPTDYLFVQRNLSQPVKFADALRLSNPAVTYAVIISDAGAARGTKDAERVKTRTDYTRLFLKELQRYTSKIIWLNPMPMHRWEGTAAHHIAHPPPHERHPAPSVMLSVLDDNHFHFQTALHLLRLAGRSV
jgi:uncharacterized protein with von Willebrand factor type A (vWA) domain